MSMWRRWRIRVLQEQAVRLEARIAAIDALMKRAEKTDGFTVNRMLVAQENLAVVRHRLFEALK